MFDQLSTRFQGVVHRLRGHGLLTEKHLREANAEVRQALLEADVHHQVVETFLTKVNAEVLGGDRVKGLQPSEQYLKVVYETLLETLGEKSEQLSFGGGTPAVVLCVGLQGSGKTTTAAKLAHWCKAQGRRPFLVPVDLARPAAIEQLHALGREWDLPVFATDAAESPVSAVGAALAEARSQLYDTVIIDTSGRLHIDDALMDELAAIAKSAAPVHTILVADAMAGQQGLVSAEAFHRVTPLTGVIVSKADGDARGGVALSCRSVLQVPIYFLGMGEKVDALEPLHPDRLASRILGMGDLATLAERVESITDRETMIDRVKKLAGGRFTLEDYRAQIDEIGKMGKLEWMLKMVPGASQLLGKIDMDRMEREMRVKRSVIDSMTVQERANTRILNGSRRKRIAMGSGTTVTVVNRLIKEFEMMQKMMKKGGRKRGVPPQLLHMMGKS